MSFFLKFKLILILLSHELKLNPSDLIKKPFYAKITLVPSVFKAIKCLFLDKKSSNFFSLMDLNHKYGLY